MELISLVKRKKESQAINLIENGVDTSCVDQDDNTALHHASAAGLVNVIISILEESVLTLDSIGKDGHTAVHFAVINKNIEALVALVTYGANINILDENGKSALDFALINKESSIIRLLCYFGTEERPTIKLVLDQNDRLAAMDFGSIMYKLKHIKAQGNIQYYSRLGVTLNTVNTTSGFFLYIAKESTEKTNEQFILSPNQHIFSDVFEVIAWGSKPDKIALNIKVDGRPRCNEEVIILPIESGVTVDIISQMDENIIDERIEYTLVSVVVNLKTASRFTIIVEEKPEIFSVSRGPSSIQPEMEPDAKIEIPEGAFTSGDKLKVNISETKDWNLESIDEDISVLFTNAMDLTMVNNSQPNKPVKMKLPIHSSIPKDDDVIILSSDKDFPDENDWTICDIKGRERNFVMFDANHFFNIINGCRMCIEKSREKRRKYWLRKRFIKQSVEYKDCIIREDQSFRIKLTGNIETDSLTDQDYVVSFNPNKKRNSGNHHTFHLTNDTKTTTIQGEVNIELQVEVRQNDKRHTATVPTVHVKSGFFGNLCHNSIDHFEAGTRALYGKEFKSELVLPVDKQTPDHTVNVMVDPSDPQCTIPVLRKNSLRRIVSTLSEENCYNLGQHLNISTNRVNKLRNEGTIRERLLPTWRPNRPNERLVYNLVEALRAIDKDEEADNVEEAFSSNMEYLD
ncbi:ANK [Mytilus edulis]|uniref:ANK n=1 Tax=Mytilus edulis TaxID=6550 RepID=A0A8S3R6R5_MYTED|nr:ANK [Mytilus edulis]